MIINFFQKKLVIFLQKITAYSANKVAIKILTDMICVTNEIQIYLGTAGNLNQSTCN